MKVALVPFELSAPPTMGVHSGWSRRLRRLRIAVPLTAVALFGTSCSDGVDQLDVGDRVKLSTYVHCGVLYLNETIDARQWVAIDLEAEGVDPMPTDWKDAENEHERIDVSVELMRDDLLAVAPVGGGTTIHYEPTVSAPGCD